jgi:hypothetical protein
VDCGLRADGPMGLGGRFASLDNVTYDHVGVKSNPSRYGTLVNALPSGTIRTRVNQLTIAFSGSIPVELDSATRAAADGLRNLCIVDGEIISYQNVTPMGNNTFRLNYLRRGNYGSSIAAHPAGSFFAVLDDAIFRMPFDPGLSGQPVWFKFVSANYWGGGVQDISKVTAYQAFFQGQNNGQLLAPGATPLIARGDCVNVGSQIFKKSTAATAWDSDCYSVDAFAGGCSVRFRPTQTNVYLMVGLNSDPLTDESYTSLDHVWELSADGIAYIYEAGVLEQPTRAFTTNDIFEIRYDGKFVTYFISGVQWRTIADPGKAFFFDTSFYTPGAAIDNVYFGALNTASTSPFIARGQCKVSDENAMKVGGVFAWDSDVYSLEGYPSAHVSWKCTDITHDMMVGLGTKPGLDSSYSSIDFAWDCASNGMAETFLRGVPHAFSITPYTPQSVFAVTYDQNTGLVKWMKDGVVYDTAGDFTTAGLTVFADSSFWSPGASLNSLQFGPTTNLKLTDTTQIGQNAATVVVNSLIFGPVNIYSAGTTITQIGTVSVAAMSVDTTQVVTIVGSIDHNFPAAQCSSCVTVATIALTSFAADESTWVARNASTGAPQAGGSWAKEFTFSVAANTPVTYYIYGFAGVGSSVSGAYSNVRNVEIKAEVMKR